MSDTEGTAAARPEDHVREFMEQLAHPETRLRTDTRRDGSDVYGGTSWGGTGRDAILARLQRIAELEAIARQIIEVHEDVDHGADIPIYIYKLAKAAMEQK